MSSLEQVCQQPIVPATYAEFRSWLLRYVEDVWGLPENFNNESDIDFEALGMDSLEAHMMASLLDDEFGITFEPMLLVDYKTLNSLAKHCTDLE